MGLKWAVQWPWTEPPGPTILAAWTGLNRRSSPGAHYRPSIPQAVGDLDELFLPVEESTGVGVDETTWVAMGCEGKEMEERGWI